LKSLPLLARPFAVGFLLSPAIAQHAGPGLHALPVDYVIVARGHGHGATNLGAAIAAAHGTMTARIDPIGVVLAVSTDPGFADAIAADPRVESVGADFKRRWLPADEPAVLAGGGAPPGAGGDPLFPLQWSLPQIGADVTAANGDRGNGVVRARVAVLDSGIVTDHEDIAPNLNLDLSVSFVPGEGLDPQGDGFNHGTHVAGIIAAPINGVGIQGVAPEAELVAVKVLDEGGSGEFGWVIEGIVYASGPDVHADVINMSLGASGDRRNAGGGGLGPLLSALGRAVNHATAAGTLVVCAAGNDAMNLNGRWITVPAQSGNGMAVSATGPIALADFDRLASYSNYGQSVIDVAAPGGDFTQYPNDGWWYDMVLSPGSHGNHYYFAAGTSMAAPHVSGLAALIVGKYGHMNPSQIKARIEHGAADILAPGDDPQSGKGRIDAVRSLQ
jgi:subtilisin family serine protease